VTRTKSSLFAAAILASLATSAQQPAPTSAVTRATLDNGLRVVLIRDPLAPVATVEQNYLVGADDTPEGFPGMAHAQEHMAFRGCAGLSGDQISAIYAQLGGYGNADTQQNVTQYFTTVPGADVDLALRVDATCMQGVVDSQSEWALEKGAIEQEVARDLSEPTYKFFTRLNELMFAGTPYAHDALGTRESFEATTGDMLKRFYQDWYAPNNAVLVVVGDIDPQPLLGTIRELYGRIPRRQVPSRPSFSLNAVKSETLTIDSDLPYVLVLIAYRLPGTDSVADYAASRVLSDVLSSQRGDLYALVPAGKALSAEFSLAERYPKASVGLAVAALPVGAEPDPIVVAIRKVLGDYATNGVPAELVQAAQRAEIASAEFERNSIPGLAAVWSDALAGRGRNSPDDDVEAIKRVTVADVNRVLREYVAGADAITAKLVPSSTGEPTSSKGFGGTEQLTAAPTRPVELPAWAASRLATPPVPRVTATWTDQILPNKLRLIVKTDTTSPTVTVLGNIRNEPKLETPPGKDGLTDIMQDLFSYGTETLDRLAYQKALDDIAATETAGFDFSVRVLKGDFARAVQLVADNELHPAFPQQAFDVVKEQAMQFVAGELKSPGYRVKRALTLAMVPPGDPEARQTTPDTIGSVTLEDVKAFRARTFRPDLTTIVVIGDVTAGDARAAIDTSFGSWKASGSPPAVTLPRVPPNKAAAEVVPDPGHIQDSVTLSQQVGITRFDPDYYALQLGDHVLGGGFYATRLYHDLRQVAGYVYTVDNELAAGKSRTTYTITYGSDPANVSNAKEIIVRDLRAMQDEPVTPAELRQAKALLVRQIWLRESSRDAVGDILLARAQIGLPLDETVRQTNRYLAITAEEIRSAFKKWIRPDGFVQVVQGPPPQ
jgi:zinc protease